MDSNEDADDKKEGAQAVDKALCGQRKALAEVGEQQHPESQRPNLLITYIHSEVVTGSNTRTERKYFGQTLSRLWKFTLTA